MRPLTPPSALTYLKYASAPRPTEPKSAAGPVSGTVPPIVIVVAVTPGAADPPARGRRGSEQRQREQEREQAHPRHGLRSTDSRIVGGPSTIEPTVAEPEVGDVVAAGVRAETNRDARALRDRLDVAREWDVDRPFRGTTRRG